MKCLLLVGLLLSEVLFGGIMFLGIARGLGLPSDGLGLELFTTTCCSCYFVLHLMRFFCFGLRHCPGLRFRLTCVKEGYLLASTNWKLMVDSRYRGERMFFIALRSLYVFEITSE